MNHAFEILNQILTSFRDIVVEKVSFWGKVKLTILQMAEELLAPPTLGAVSIKNLGFSK